MDANDEILMGLRMLTGYNRRTRVVAANVLSASLGNASCDVTDEEGNVLYDVRLRASLGASNPGVIVVPAVGSFVLIANLGGVETEWVVVATSEVEKVVVEIETTNLEVSQDGVKIQRGSEDLRTLLGDLITAVKALTVTCAAPGSPSSIPINQASFVALQTRLNNLLD